MSRSFLREKSYLHLIIISFFWNFQELNCHCFFHTLWPVGSSIQLWWITCHSSGHVSDETNLRSKGLELNALLDCFDLYKARTPPEAFWKKDHTNFETLRKLELLKQLRLLLFLIFPNHLAFLYVNSIGFKKHCHMKSGIRTKN